ncbi:MAG: YncE family protein, partial [Armatimonadota bacterium]|nr:YncE family protein [Armatimonadota bacterium]
MKRRIPLFATIAVLAAGLSAFGLSHARRGTAGKAVVLPDVPRNGGAATILPNGWQITPAGTSIALPGDLPLKMTVSADDKFLLVNTGGYHDHSVSVLDLTTKKLAQSLNVGKTWAGMCLNRANGDLYLSGGGAPEAGFLKDAAKMGAGASLLESFHHPIERLSFHEGKLDWQTPLDIPGLSEQTGKGIKRERYIAGLDWGKNGFLYAVNTQNDTVYKINPQTDAVDASTVVGYRPYAAALSPDGAFLAVSNWGGQSVSLLNAQSMKETARIPVGSQPNELVWGKDGRLFVANAGSNSVSVIHGGKVVETIKTSLSPADPVGSTPDALALSPDGARLYVANAGNNDVAVIDTSDPKESDVLGFIPTGWYPSA